MGAPVTAARCDGGAVGFPAVLPSARSCRFPAGGRLSPTVQYIHNLKNLPNILHNNCEKLYRLKREVQCIEGDCIHLLLAGCFISVGVGAYLHYSYRAVIDWAWPASCPIDALTNEIKALWGDLASIRARTQLSFHTEPCWRGGK